jgi:PPE-repeat protein
LEVLLLEFLKQEQLNIYNGATWTAGSNMTTARSSFGSAKSGSSALNLAFGGNTGPAATNATEEYVDYSRYAGQTVENVGQVWYNGTTKALKFTDETFTDWLGLLVQL